MIETSCLEPVPSFDNKKKNVQKAAAWSRIRLLHLITQGPGIEGCCNRKMYYPTLHYISSRISALKREKNYKSNQKVLANEMGTRTNQPSLKNSPYSPVLSTTVNIGGTGQCSGNLQTENLKMVKDNVKC